MVICKACNGIIAVNAVSAGRVVTLYQTLLVECEGYSVFFLAPVHATHIVIERRKLVNGMELFGQLDSLTVAGNGIDAILQLSRNQVQGREGLGQLFP